MTKINRTWFLNELNKEDRSGRKLAKFLGIDPSSVSRMLSGDRRMTLDEAAKVSEYLNQPLKTVLEQAGIKVDKITPLRSNMVPVIGTVSAEGVATLAALKTRPFVPSPPDAPGGTLALVYDTAMTEYEMVDGWCLYYTPHDGIDPMAFNELSVFEDDAGTIRVRVLKKGTEPMQYRLYNLRGELKETVYARSATPVIWIKC